MQHVAIMRKSWGLTDKILSGEKVIESRWYKFKRPPWNQIKTGDTIYFKNSGEPVKIKAQVSKVLQFDNLTPSRVKEILQKYGKEDGIDGGDLPKFGQLFKDKKYCMLIYLKGVESVKPFDINKKGFGMMAAWITVENVRKITKHK